MCLENGKHSKMHMSGVSLADVNSVHKKRLLSKLY